MDEQEAIQLARNWIVVRKRVRAQLIAAARAVHPASQFGFAIAGQGDENTVRKLYQFPSDLSEERLLRLIDNPAE